MRFASFFSGVGGFELGLTQAGHECVFSCEIDPFARAVFHTRFGHLPAGRDIRELRAGAVPDADLWVGGFPCQDLSSAGKRTGWGGERSVLIFDLLRLARRARPRWLLLENVPGLLSVRGGRDFGALLAHLDELGYVGAWRVLDARYFGVPQRRRRVFIVCHLGDGADPGEVLLEPESGGGRPETRRRAGEDAARAVTARAAKGVSQREDDDTFITGDLAAPLGCQSSGSGGPRANPYDGGGALVVANTVRPGHRRVQANSADNIIPFDLAQVTHPENRSLCLPGDPAPTLARRGQPHVAYNINAAGSTAKESHAHETETARCVDTSGGYAAGQGGTVAIGFTGNAAQDATRDASPTLRMNANGGGRAAVAFGWQDQEPKASELAGPVRTHHRDAVAYQQHGSDVGEMGALRRGHGDVQSGVPFLATAVTADAHGASPTGHPGRLVPDTMAVRRLTPLECERLQGFPDNWTDIKGSSDTTRYKAIGNAVAVPCIAWIGRRLRRAERCTGIGEF